MNNLLRYGTLLSNGKSVFRSKITILDQFGRNYIASSSNKIFDGQIPMEKLIVSYIPSVVGGGINAGEASRPTKAQVKFRVSECDWIESKRKEKFFEKFKHRIDKDGYFVVRSERTSSGSLNVADCLDKLRFSIREIEIDAESDSLLSRTTKEEVEQRRATQEIEAVKRLQVKRVG